MKRLLSLILVSFVFAISLCAQQPSADAILKTAYQEATAQNKNVLLIFHASWCAWCHKMDTSINDPACSKFFHDNYVITHMTVYENKDKANEENPGALELLTQYHGDDYGIPFWLVFDKNGKLLATSKFRPDGPNGREENTGCPANEKEVDYFISVLKQTSSMTPSQLEIVKKRFRQNE